MRITAGFLKGQKLIETKRDQDLRPTTDRNREALFNILQNSKFIYDIGFELENSTILDLCSGTGAVAFESISRGSKKAILIDKDPKHIEIAKKNAQKLKINNQTQIILGDALKPLNLNEEIDLVFIDPPYKFKFDKILRRILDCEMISDKTLIIIESDKEESFDQDLKLLEQRKYGITYFNFFVKNENI